jgi:hypothetical protein
MGYGVLVLEYVKFKKGAEQLCSPSPHGASTPYMTMGFSAAKDAI